MFAYLLAGFLLPECLINLMTCLTHFVLDAVKFRLSKDETCCHDLPKAGKAIILRHTTSSDWKTLFITEIRDYTSKGKPLTVTLSFSNWKDFRMWEEELRSKLKGRPISFQRRGKFVFFIGFFFLSNIA